MMDELEKRHISFNKPWRTKHHRIWMSLTTRRAFLLTEVHMAKELGEMLAEILAPKRDRQR